MGLQITCDKCGKEANGDFAIVSSTFYTTTDTEPVEYRAPGDEFYLCDRCYEQLLKVVE